MISSNIQRFHCIDNLSIVRPLFDGSTVLGPQLIQFFLYMVPGSVLYEWHPSGLPLFFCLH